MQQAVYVVVALIQSVNQSSKEILLKWTCGGEAEDTFVALAA